MAPPKSEVWRHFIKDGKVAQCKHCLQVVASSANTTNMWSHLKNKHSISRSMDANNNAKKQVDGVDANSREASTVSGAREGLNVDHASPSSIDLQSKANDDASNSSSSAEAGHDEFRKRRNHENEDHDFSAKRFKLQTLELTYAKAGSFSETGHKTTELNNALLYMMCKDNLPLSTVEHTGFRCFAKVAVPLYKPPSRNTLTRMVDARYESYKEIMKNHFSKLKSITLTGDIWTEDQTKQSYLGITVHYLPELATDNEIRTANIGIVPLSESHTSAYIARMIRETLFDWDIPIDTVSLMVTDNGANMVAAAKEVFGSSRHIGCYGHTLNLVVTQALAVCPALEKVINKIKSIVTFFKSSVVASDNLKTLQIRNGKTEGTLLKLVQDVETRWNSKYQMLDRFVMLADIISTVLLKLGNTGRDMLSGSELATTAEAVRLLKPMFLATEELSAEKYTTTSKVIPICRLMKQSISAIEVSDKSIVELKQNLLAGIDKRFAHVERVHVFSITTLLDPRFKRLHFSSAVTQSATIQHVSNLMKATIRESESQARALAQEKEIPLIDPDNLWSIHDSMVAVTPSVSAEDTANGVPAELRQFLNTPLAARSANPIAVWRDLRSTFPYLAEIALKYLSMVATSVPSERLFSKAGSTVTKQRNRLLGKRISKLLFLGSLCDEMWFK